MKTFIPVFFCFLLAINPGYSQKRMGKENRQKIKSLKIAYITEQLNLTEKEAQKFWPIYNAHEVVVNQIRFSERKMMRKIVMAEEGFNSLSEKDADKMLSALMKNEKKIFEAHQQFMKKLSDVLPSYKILKLEHTERTFKQKMLERLKRMRRPRDKN